MVPLIATKREFDILKEMIDATGAEIPRRAASPSSTWSAP